jgi:hypothetical protein
MRRLACLFTALALAAPARADAPPTTPATTPTQLDAAAPKHDRGAFVLGVKAGGLFPEPFSPLGPSFLVDVEVGYLLPLLSRGLALVADVGYSQPEATGMQSDPRLASGSASWSLTERELMIGATALYRATWIGTGRVAPYLGIGARMWLLQSHTDGQAGSAAIRPSDESSLRFGLSVPLGVDIRLGRGALFVEALLLWAPVAQLTTGEASLGALAASLGYRLFL